MKLGSPATLQDDESRGIAQFADTYWPQARQDFLDALLRNDRASLARMREEGLFSHWLSAGLRALGEASALSLMEKRRRAAWVLALGSPARPTMLPHSTPCYPGSRRKIGAPLSSSCGAIHASNSWRK